MTVTHDGLVDSFNDTRADPLSLCLQPDASPLSLQRHDVHQDLACEELTTSNSIPAATTHMHRIQYGRQDRQGGKPASMQ